MPTSNKQMTDMLRKGRDDLSSYMYQGKEEAPDATVVAIEASPEASTEEAVPPTEAAIEEPAGPQLLEPGAEDPPDQYVYAPGDTPGSLVMYPPGTPCDSGGYRVAMTDPATAEDVTQIQTMLDEAAGTGVEAEMPEESEVY